MDVADCSGGELRRAVQLQRMCVAVAIGLGLLVVSATAHAATWRIASTPTPSASVPRDASLAAVSCASASMCIAVGAYGAPGGGRDQDEPPGGTLAELWNGSSWSLQATPSIPNSSLTGISCPSISDCVAVGFSHATSASTQDPTSGKPLVEVWNGAAWSVQGDSSPASGQAELDAVSCSSPTACVAVGASAASATAGGSSALSEYWNGITWQRAIVPGPGTAGPTLSLSSVSCATTSLCAAIGVYLGYGNVERTLTAEWDGAAWSVQSGPAPHRTYPFLNAVGCGAGTGCEAVGGGTAEAYNGSTWSAQSVPLPGGNQLDDSSLSGVSCPSVTACVSVGSTAGGAGTPAGTTFAEAFDGSGWTLGIVPVAAGGAQPQLNAVSCVRAAFCVAVGFEIRAGVAVALAIGDDGSGWSMQPTPALVTTITTSRLAGVSCSAGAVCAAVGASAAGAFVLKDAPGGWSIQAVLNPDASTAATITSPGLTAVACKSARRCLAVGNYQNAAGNSATFAELWNGTRWSLAKMPGEGDDTDTSLAAIACLRAQNCLAAGNQAVGVGEPMSTTSSALTERWTGLRWIYQGGQPDSPATGGGAENSDNSLTGISCSSNQHCTAVGSASEDDGCKRCGTLAERLGPHGWSLQRPSQASGLQSVDCPTATRCVAVGQAAAQVWDGRTWKRQPIASARGGQLNTVSCPARRLCVAAGTDRHRDVLVERWNGRRWSRLSSPDPAGARQIAVSGISCPSRRSCVLVGSDQGASGTTVSLIETYG